MDETFTAFCMDAKIDVMNKETHARTHFLFTTTGILAANGISIESALKDLVLSCELLLITFSKLNVMLLEFSW